jgi:hypothetical protein
MGGRAPEAPRRRRRSHRAIGGRSNASTSRTTLIMLRAQRCRGEGRLQQQPQSSLDALKPTHGTPPVATRAAVIDTCRWTQAAERRRRRRRRWRRGVGVGGRLNESEQP